MLMNYPDAPAPRGSRLVPEVAQGCPRISKDGKTYTFTLKNTYRFSNGKRVTAANYAAAINRNLNPRMASPAQPFIQDIVGASGRHRRSRRRGRRRASRCSRRTSLQIRLTKRAPDLLSRLAMPFFAPIPTNMPINPDGVRAPIVGSGPYYIAKWEPKRAITLLRNKLLQGPAAAQREPDRLRHRPASADDPPEHRVELDRLRAGPAGGSCRAGSEVRRPEGFSGPVLRQPVGRVPLPGDEPRPAALRRLAAWATSA